MKTKKGFTLIEIILVLAIAGLIISMVFITVPKIRASERNTSRREAVIHTISTLKSFQMNNNRGALPGSSGTDKDSLEHNKIIRIYDNGTETGVENGDKHTDTTPHITSWHYFYDHYLKKDTFKDPNFDSYYTLKIMKCSATTADSPCTDANNLVSQPFNSADNTNTIFLVVGATCSGESAVLSNNPRRVAALIRLESSGIYCENT